MNDELRMELEAMHEADQSIRKEAITAVREHGMESAEYVALRDRGREMDARHRARLVEIVEVHGWPTVPMVGTDASHGAFLVLQHAELKMQKRFLPLLREATERGESPTAVLPLLEDRILMREGMPQIYGTQVVPGDDGKATLWEIEDEEHVAERRETVGLEPLDEYLARFE